MINNAILDIDFLNSLLHETNREIFARITVLTQQEEPIEYIEGKVTTGSINVDGKSTVRRTCSLTLVAENIDINAFYWNIQNKFKLEVGISNYINNAYDDIIYFPQGIYLITNFDTNFTTKNYQISIKGKDKMSMLNGEFGGHLPHSTDFGKEEYHDLKADTVTYTDIPIKTIIQEILRNFGNEIPSNIIINDIDEAGFELLEYRGSATMYILREVESDIYTNLCFNDKQPCWYRGSQGWTETVFKDEGNIIYDNLVDLDGEIEPTEIRLVNADGAKTYYLARFVYGDVPGYRLTDLTYAGELISKAGDTVVTVLDKLKNMLGDFEYFYNLDGRFVFQKTKKYNAINWYNSEVEDILYNDATLNMEEPVFSFLDNTLVISLKNNPKLTDLKNDYTIWGTRRLSSGTEIPIHARYAIDIKPEYYKNYNGNIFIATKELQKQLTGENINYVDWREIIYQMALDYRKHYHDDDFLYQIAQNNKDYYPSGITGYERYYIDMEGFWRELYNPNPEPLFEDVTYLEAKDCHINQELYLQNSYRKLNEDEKDELVIDVTKLYVLDYSRVTFGDQIIGSPDIIPFIGSRFCHLNYQNGSNKIKSDDIYFFLTEDNILNGGTNLVTELNKVKLENIYIKRRGPFYTLESCDPDIDYENRDLFYVEQNEDGPITPPEEEPLPPDDEEEVDLTGAFITEDNKIFKTSDEKKFIIRRAVQRLSNNTIYKTETNEELPIMEQFWVYLYPIENSDITNPYDYTNYVAQQLENYLNEYKWDNLYIKTNDGIYFDDLDPEIQRLYYKQTSELAEYLVMPQYDNFNEIKTNYSEISLQIYTYSTASYSKSEEYIQAIADLSKKYLNLSELDGTTENAIKTLSLIQRKNYDTEEEFKQALQEAYDEYLLFLQNKYSQQINDYYWLYEFAQYKKGYYNFNRDFENGDFWSHIITKTPEQLIFWFDFINGQTSHLSKYSVQTIGPRTKVINDKDVKAIYYKEVPNTIFITSQEEKQKYEHQSGYTYIQLPKQMESIFSVSSRGKSANSAVEDLIYKHCYSSEQITVQTTPIYHLQPNTRIYIKNEDTNIDGEYLISKLTIPLDQKKMMSITATKVIPSIL